MQSPSPDTNQPFALPARLPMIVLDDCYHFPGCHLPLFIFEKRYRLMLDHALRADRMFCVGVHTCGDGVLPVVTAGLIRASFKNPDGTSQVMLQGVQRMRIIGWEQTVPFRIARVEPLHSQDASLERMREYKSRALDLLPLPTNDSCDSMQKLREGLRQMEEIEMVCDIIAFHFVRRKAALRAILEESHPERRYEHLLSDLEASAA